MDYERKQRSDKYHQKKHLQQKYDKVEKHKFNQQQSNLLQSIQCMSASELYKFIQNKFDKVVGTNEKLLPKLFSAIRKRINNIMSQFQQSQRTRFAKFITKHTANKATQQDVREVFQAKSYRPFKLTSNQLIHISYVWGRSEKPKIFMAQVSIFQPKQQVANIKQRYYINGIDENILEGLEIKRFRKDCPAILQNYIEVMKKVDEALNQK